MLIILLELLGSMEKSFFGVFFFMLENLTERYKMYEETTAKSLGILFSFVRDEKLSLRVLYL